MNFANCAAMDQFIRGELLKMTDTELCSLVSIDLHCLQGLKDSGATPEMGVWRRYLEEVEVARSILKQRWYP